LVTCVWSQLIFFKFFFESFSVNSFISAGGDSYSEEVVRASLEHPLTCPMPLFNRYLPISPTTEVSTKSGYSYVPSVLTTCYFPSMYHSYSLISSSVQYVQCTLSLPFYHISYGLKQIRTITDMEGDPLKWVLVPTPERGPRWEAYGCLPRGRVTEGITLCRILKYLSQGIAVIYLSIIPDLFVELYCCSLIFCWITFLD
jgi:hypothetical protein